MGNFINNKLEQYLKTKNAYKLVCGANNQNYSEIEKLSSLFYSSGVKFFDTTASIEAINAIKNGLNKININRQDVFICISVGVKNDPHLTKYKIDNTNCINCGICQNFCVQNAIIKKDNKTNIIEKNCIGCGICYEKCKNNAISSYGKNLNFEQFLPQLFELVDCIELHISSNNIDDIDNKWEYLCNNYNGFLGICVDRNIFSSNELINQLKKMLSKRPEYSVIIQADGNPMRGGSDDYRTTLQTIATADIIDKANLKAYLMLSGGTNSKTKELANMCNINYDAIAYGSFARKLVSSYTSKENLSNDDIKKVVEIIKNKINI